MARHSLFLAYILSVGSIALANGQTTLSGDHIISGKLNVGTTGSLGGLEITGQTGISAAPGIKVTGDGGVVFEGNIGTGTIPATGVGARFMWYPKKAATRIGLVTDSEAWADVFIGVGSFAVSDSVASGASSVSFGGYAYGNSSVAMNGGLSDGSGSVAMSQGTTTGSYSTAFSGGIADGDMSVSMSGGTALALGSTTMGTGIAAGSYSVSLSNGVTDGSYSTAMSGGFALGDFSTAMGVGVHSVVYSGFVAGTFNEEYPNVLSVPQETDPLFVVGNGTGFNEDSPEKRLHDALVVYRSGKVKIARRQGDIEMGDFGIPGSGD